jgi:hypothetical protein
MKQLWEEMPEQLRSFPQFCCYLLREQGLATTPTKQQVAVAQWMQDGPDRQLTVAFRGLGKSLLASYYALWRLGMDPEEKILVVQLLPSRPRILRSSCFAPWLKWTYCSAYCLDWRTDPAMSPLMWPHALLNSRHRSRFRRWSSNHWSALYLCSAG